MEKQNYSKIFSEHLKKSRDKRIAIYGMGAIARELLELRGDFTFVELYDRDLQEGEWMGIPIGKLSRTNEKKVQILVVAAQPNHVYSIFLRIYPVLKDSGIYLCNIYGEDLFELYGIQADRYHEEQCYSECENLLKAQIDSHEIISFDIFDTLIMRKVFEPHDVFRVVEERAKKEGLLAQGFYEARIKAERQLLCVIPTLEQLYREYAKLTGSPWELCIRLMELELSVEDEIIVPRVKMVEMLEYACSRQKQVYLISDMYWPKEVLAKVLHNKGINHFKEIYVSCDYHESKTGELFRIFRSQVPGSSYLHIGDHRIYDGEFAQKAGMDSFVIEKASALFELSSFAECIQKASTWNDRVLLGLAVCRLYHNPFCIETGSNRLRLHSITDLAYTVVGSTMAAFAEWFARMIHNGDEKILLGARDGWLVKQLLEKRLDNREQKRLIYFYTSRIACLCCNITCKEEFWQAIRREPGISLETCLMERLDLDITSETITDQNGIKDFYEKMEPEIRKKSEINREHYGIYCDRVGLDGNQSCLFFDLASSGTCLQALCDRLSLKARGVFLERYDTEREDRKDLEIESFFQETKNPLFWKYYQFYELILTSREPSLLKFNEQGEPVFDRETRTSEELAYLDILQAAVMEFDDEFRSLCDDSELTEELVDALIQIMNPEKWSIPGSDHLKLAIYDTFGEGKIPLFS